MIKSYSRRFDRTKPDVLLLIIAGGQSQRNGGVLQNLPDSC